MKTPYPSQFAEHINPNETLRDEGENYFHRYQHMNMDVIL